MSAAQNVRNNRYVQTAGHAVSRVRTGAAKSVDLAQAGTWAARTFENPTALIRELMRTKPVDGTVTLRTRDGLSIMIRQNVWDAKIVLEIFRDQPYVRDLTLPDNPVVVDIGAYIGDFSLYLAHYVKAHVLSYEPTIENMAILNQNVQMNAMEHLITAENKAVGDGQPVTLNVSKAGSEIHVSQYWYEGQEQRSIESVRLEDLISTHNLDRIDLLKIDCEGCEYDLFDIVPQSALAIVANVALEYHHISDWQIRLERLQKRLADGGFDVSIRGLILTARSRALARSGVSA